MQPHNSFSKPQLTEKYADSNEADRLGYYDKESFRNDNNACGPVIKDGPLIQLAGSIPTRFTQLFISVKMSGSEESCPSGSWCRSRNAL
jgi:hypothetical protein